MKICSHGVLMACFGILILLTGQQSIGEALASERPDDVPGPSKPVQRGSEPKQSDQMSNILLYTQHGRPIRFYDDLVKDKVVLINLMYTTCPKICPGNSAQLARLNELLEPWMGRDITMLSLSIDPKVDTPERLKRYWEAFGSKPGWLFLTGDYDEIDQLRRQLGVYDLDPVIDQDKTQHAGIVTFGNDRTNRWTALPILMQVRQLAQTVLRTTWDGRWHRRHNKALKPANKKRVLYKGRGIIRSVDAQNGEVLIHHERIPGQMPAMTMMFKVSDRSMLEGLAPDQRVDFLVERTQDEFEIRSINLPEG